MAAQALIWEEVCAQLCTGQDDDDENDDDIRMH